MTYDIIVATYNGENYLSQQLVSLLNQTVAPEHIYIRDDLSNDRTIEIIKEFAKTSHIPIVLLESNENLGYIKNFESLSKETLADIVFFCDQDDVWVLNKAELMMQEFANHPECKLLFSDAFIVNEKLEKIAGLWNSINFKPEIHSFMLARIIDDNFVTGATIAIKRSYLLSLVPFPEGIVHDYWMAINSIVDNNIACINKKLIFYRQHQSNQIGIKSRGLIEKIFGYYDRHKVLNRINYGRDKLVIIHELLKRRPELVLNDDIKEYVLYFKFLNKIHGGRYSRLFWHEEIKACLIGSEKNYSFLAYLRNRRFKNMAMDLFDYIYISICKGV